MDEISPGGRTLVWEIRDGGVKEWILDPSVYGLAHDDLASLAGGDPAANAERVMRLLEGAKDPAGKAAVLLNSAAAIYVAGLEASFAKAVERARESVSCGAARQALERLQKEAGRAAER